MPHNKKINLKVNILKFFLQRACLDLHFLTAGPYAHNVPHAELQLLLALCSQSSSPRLARQGTGAKESCAAMKHDIYKAPVPYFQNQPLQSFSLWVCRRHRAGCEQAHGTQLCSCPSDIAPFPPVHLDLKLCRVALQQTPIAFCMWLPETGALECLHSLEDDFSPQL